MRSKKTAVIPARLEACRQRFERWRRTRQGHSRIPEPLWTSAVRLAGAYGLCKTARTLGLDYNALKRRVASARPGDSLTPKTVGAKVARQETATAFVELVPPQGVCLPECVVELEHPHGAKMRIRLTGQQTSEVVAAVSQAFLSAKP
jgi:hypothetical protein